MVSRTRPELTPAVTRFSPRAGWANLDAYAEDGYITSADNPAMTGLAFMPDWMYVGNDQVAIERFQVQGVLACTLKPLEVDMSSGSFKEAKAIEVELHEHKVSDVCYRLAERGLLVEPAKSVSLSLHV